MGQSCSVLPCGVIVGNQYEVTRARNRWLCAGLSKWRITAEDLALETLEARLASFWPVVTVEFLPVLTSALLPLFESTAGWLLIGSL